MIRDGLPNVCEMLMDIPGRRAKAQNMTCQEVGL